MYLLFFSGSRSCCWCASWDGHVTIVCSVYVGQLPDPSWNTDQGVQYMRKSMGVTKPYGEMKVKACFTVSFRVIPRLLQLRAQHGPGRCSLRVGLRLSAYTETRKMVTYTCSGWSQRKLWWKTVAVLTCKSIVRSEYRGERLIEPSSSWFPPKFPSG